MHVIVKNLLQCPSCGGFLIWNNEIIKDDIFILEAEISCQDCTEIYFVKEEIGYFLTSLERNDLWEQSESNLMKFLANNPEIEKKLMKSPIDTLSPADLFFRSMILEDQKQFQIAEDLQEIAGKNLYTEEYRSCSEKAIDYICELNIPKEIPILDIASGKGYLAFQLLEKLPNHIIISDFSPQIIKKNKLRLEQKNLLNVSLLVFDARKTPFKSNSIEIMTTNLGLGNIQNPGGLLQEMKRILHGNFYPIMFFFNEDDIEHKKFIQDNNLSPLLFLEFTLESFKKQHFVIKTGFECSSFAKPTPQGEIIQAGIDSLPIKETILKWIVFQINY